MGYRITAVLPSVCRSGGCHSAPALLPSRTLCPQEKVSDAAFEHWKAKGSTWESLPQVLPQQQTCHEHACCWTQQKNEQNPPQDVQIHLPSLKVMP